MTSPRPHSGWATWRRPSSSAASSSFHGRVGSSCKWNSIFAFWFAYVITRPIGASFADYLSKGHDVSGADFGDWQTALVLTCVVAILVGYTAVARYDIQTPGIELAGGT